MIIPHSAGTDLSGNISGRFSPDDWQSILAQAEERLKRKLDEAGTPDRDRLWSEVVREFHTQSYWGYTPNYRDARAPKKTDSNIGVSLIVLAFLTFTFALMAAVWVGQIYTFSDDPNDKYRFFAVLVVVLMGFVAFLWRNRNFKD